METPKLPEVRWPLKATRDDFDKPTLGFDWIFMRNPAPESWSLQESPGNLVLRGNKTSLDEAGAPAFVGRRLCHLSCNIATLLNYEPVRDGEEAGLTVYMNQRYHYDLAVKLKEGRKVIVFRRTVGSLRTESVLDCPAGSVILKLEARPEWFCFSVQPDQSDELELGSGESHLLSTEVAGGFTGIIVAMYALCETGHGSPARFDWFDYNPAT
jgi:alpha-N-arabinofuranosidase